MANQNDDTRAPAPRRSVHSCTDDFPNFTDVVADPKDDPVLVKYAGIGALTTAGEQIDSLDRDAQANLRYELIDQHVSMAMKDGCSRNDAIGYAMERFGVSSRTVETALDYMKQNRETEAARPLAHLTTTPEAEAKAKAFKANEAEIKAKAKQRFLRFKAKLMLWLKLR
jgi:hypothetical protein